MENKTNTQYSLARILGIWLAVGLPMWVLGWGVYPQLSAGLGETDAALMRIQLLTVGLIWQFILSMWILYREEGSLSFETIRSRFWLNHPISRKTGLVQKSLWWWVIPLLILTAVFEIGLSPILGEVWINMFPSLAEPAGYGTSALFAPEMQPLWVGNWGFLAVFVLTAIFNTFLGEEFLFRGVLLPKMEGVFGKWDWAANGLLFTFYHLHQPWGLLAGIPAGLLFAWSGKYFRSNWFPIILHSAQSVLFFFVILGLVLGLA